MPDSLRPQPVETSSSAALRIGPHKRKSFHSHRGHRGVMSVQYHAPSVLSLTIGEPHRIRPRHVERVARSGWGNSAPLLEGSLRMTRHRLPRYAGMVLAVCFVALNAEAASITYTTDLQFGGMSVPLVSATTSTPPDIGEGSITVVPVTG